MARGRHLHANGGKPTAVAFPGKSGSAGGIHSSFVRNLDRGFLHFLLILVGLGSLVAGSWNQSRHQRLGELRDRRDHLEQERMVLEASVAEKRGWYEGVENDPRLRGELLERMFGGQGGSGVPIEEWLRVRDRIPGS